VVGDHRRQPNLARRVPGGSGSPPARVAELTCSASGRRARTDFRRSLPFSKTPAGAVRLGHHVSVNGLLHGLAEDSYMSRAWSPPGWRAGRAPRSSARIASLADVDTKRLLGEVELQLSISNKLWYCSTQRGFGWVRMSQVVFLEVVQGGDDGQPPHELRVLPKLHQVFEHQPQRARPRNVRPWT